MALKTLETVRVMDGFQVTRSVTNFSSMRPVFINDEKNEISFKIQDGPVGTKGVNGCQVDTIIVCAREILEGLNAKNDCEENWNALKHLDVALDFLTSRRKNREERKVEGTEYI